MKEPEEYIDKVKFSLDAYASVDALRMKISNRDGLVEHARSIENDVHYLTYSTCYRPDPKTKTNVRHSISSEGNSNIIRIDKFHDDFSVENKTYDLISGLAYPTYAKDEDRRPITPEQKILLIQELQKATINAKKITLNNMSVPKKQAALKKHL